MRRIARALALALTTAPFCVAAPAEDTVTTPPIKVAMVPKLVGLPVLLANARGAKVVASKLGIDFLYTGPVTASAAGQVDIINSLVARRFNVIATTANNPTQLAPSLRRARSRGIAVVTYDSDVSPDARDFFIQDTDYGALGKAMVDGIERYAGPDAKVAILSSVPDATIQQEWIKAIRDYMGEHFPQMSVVTTQYGRSSPSQSLTAGLDILQSHPDVAGIIAPDAAAVVGAAAAVQKLGRIGKVFVSDTCDPDTIRQYVKAGIIKESPLWDEIKEGELMLYVARLAANKAIGPNSTFTAGDLGPFTAHDQVIVFSAPLVFTAANIDNYHF